MEEETKIGSASNVFRTLGLPDRDMRIFNLVQVLLVLTIFIASSIKVRDYIAKFVQAQSNPSPELPAPIIQQNRDLLRSNPAEVPLALSGEIVYIQTLEVRLRSGYSFIVDENTIFTVPLTSLSELRVGDHLSVTCVERPCVGKSVPAVKIGRAPAPVGGRPELPGRNCPSWFEVVVENIGVSIAPVIAFISRTATNIEQACQLFYDVLGGWIIVWFVFALMELIKRMVLNRIETINFNLTQKGRPVAFVKKRRWLAIGTVHENTKVSVTRNRSRLRSRRNVFWAKKIEILSTGATIGFVNNKKKMHHEILVGAPLRWEGYSERIDNKLHFVLERKSNEVEGDAMFYSVQMKAKYWRGIRGGDKTQEMIGSQVLTVKGHWSTHHVFLASSIIASGTDEIIKP